MPFTHEWHCTFTVRISPFGPDPKPDDFHGFSYHRNQTATIINPLTGNAIQTNFITSAQEMQSTASVECVKRAIQLRNTNEAPLSWTASNMVFLLAH